MSSSLERLIAQVRGTVITEGDDGYEEARRVYNGMIDKRPGAIIRPADRDDVSAVVRFAGETGTDLSIRGGSHSVPGFGTNDGGVVLDLSSMRGVRVDPENRTARAEGGCTWGELDDATHEFGLATVGGVVSTTGIAGLTLGGGIGYLTRSRGLTVDNLVSAEVVTASGELVRASEDEHPDLFWALRGGGGNFGVVVEFEYRLHPVDTIYGGPLFFEGAEARDVLEAFTSYMAGDAPRQLGGFFTWQLGPAAPFIPEDRHGEPMCGIVACWSGPPEEGETAFEPVLAMGSVVGHALGPMPYPALNSAFDLPHGLRHYWKANFVADVTDDLLDAHRANGPNAPTLESAMHLHAMTGAVHDARAHSTAFGNRDASFATVIAGIWTDADDDEANIQWVRDYYAATSPFSRAGGYINFQSEEEGDHAEQNYGPTYARLAEIKRTYDPDNVFRVNQNIPPAG
ncbi:MAG: FAD-binding oxidoreductase [Gemmatimonadetes bacterium]|nr:FAD-binding oxidoreductase [Gemmatimonadota bacterium]